MYIQQPFLEWKNSSTFKAVDGDTIYALAITARHPLFEDVLALFNQYNAEHNLPIINYKIASEEQINNTAP